MVKARGLQRAFTLIELLIALAILALMLSVAVPRYFSALDNAREVALRENLTVLRDAIDKHYTDTGTYPQTLEELVTRKYLRRIPSDPITSSATTWVVVPPENREQGSVFDIHSGAAANARDGTPYKSW